MEKTTKILLWAGGGLLLVIGGILLAPKMLNASAKSKKDEEVPDETTTPANTGGGGSTTNVNPIGSVEDVKKFQDWMDAKHPNWLNNGTSLNKGGGYGNFGSQTSAAWSKYSAEYLSAGNKPGATVMTYKAYSANKYNPIYSNVSNLVPFRFAGDSEYLGTLTGVIKKDYSGTSYAEIKQPDGKNRYALYNTIKLQP